MRKCNVEKQRIIDNYLNGIAVYKIKLKYKTSHRMIKLICEESGVWSRELNIKNIIRHSLDNRKVKKNYFNDFENQNCYYWLGFLAADGNVSSKLNTIGVSLQIKDISHLMKYVEFLGGGLTINRSIHHKKYEQANVRFNDKESKDFLISLGITPNKTFTIKVKDDIINWHFIRGLVDGDGCIGFYKYKKHTCFISITTASYEFAKQIKSFINLNGILCNIYKNKTNIYELRVSCFKQCKLFLEKMYYCADTFLERKYANAQLISNYQLKTDLKLRETAQSNPEASQQSILE
jgi:hypothetical protein